MFNSLYMFSVDDYDSSSSTTQKCSFYPKYGGIDMPAKTEFVL